MEGEATATLDGKILNEGNVLFKSLLNSPSPSECADDMKVRSLWYAIMSSLCQPSNEYELEVHETQEAYCIVYALSYHTNNSGPSKQQQERQFFELVVLSADDHPRFPYGDKKNPSRIRSSDMGEVDEWLVDNDPSCFLGMATRNHIKLFRRVSNKTYEALTELPNRFYMNKAQDRYNFEIAFDYIKNASRTHDILKTMVIEKGSD
ncbi:hypothetical protein BT63DRAFT_458825 [Microthyrium microscopicum]|uniref:Uncharacterized protein n=1 Tax=Microthyrium microscopicum TaxID=703497 RepID=A0A6A6U4V0_9PEZI|nr:hypothetical protein BT63DRAFT_458825 [Microthyrium microscopicum]